jgi:transposase
MSKVVGIDVSKETLDVAVMTGAQHSAYVKVPNSTAGYQQLVRWLNKHASKGCAVCLEATGRYGDGVAETLYEAGFRVSVVNPARIRGYADSQLRRNKTDKLDAQLIADFCRTQQPEPWTPPAPEIRQLQALVRHLASLEETRQQLVNRLRDATSLPEMVVTQLRTQEALLVEQIRQIQHAIQDHIDQFPDLRTQRDLIDSIPGLGPLTAAKILAEVPPLASFTDVRQLVAFAGLNPAHHESGISVRKKSQISRTGKAALRAALYMPAVVAKRHNPILRAFAQRLLDRGLCQMAVITAVMRKLLHLIYGILKSGRPFDPNFQVAS